MHLLKGKLLNIYHVPGGTNRQTGEQYKARDKIQLLDDMPTRSGETRYDVIELTVENPEDYRDFMGQEVTVPVRPFPAMSNGKPVIRYDPLPNGSRQVSA
jgi:hypothetical protein